MMQHLRDRHFFGWCIIQVSPHGDTGTIEHRRTGEQFYWYFPNNKTIVFQRNTVAWTFGSLYFVSKQIRMFIVRETARARRDGT
jgi:hypothetical protein